MMKRILSVLLSCVIFFSLISVKAYEFPDDDILSIDAFDQADEDTLEQWFTWFPVDTYNHKTYHDLLNNDFARTFHELVIPFKTGRIEGSEHEQLCDKYGLNALSVIYRLDEFQQTFNAAYGTDIDMISLDGLQLDGMKFINVIDNYVIVTISPHGTMANPNPRGGRLLRNGSEYWIYYYQDDWNSADDIYTIISYKNVAGYDVRTIDYIGFEPPSDEILSAYTQDTTSTSVSIDNDYYQGNYKKYISALYEAFNNQYIDPYSGKSYSDNDNFVYIAILSLWKELALSRDSETVKYFEDIFSSEELPNGQVVVYNTKELAQVLRFKFENVDLYELLNSGFYGLLYSDDDYVVLASSGYGDRIEEMVIDKFETINDNTVYVEWHADYHGNKSSDMYAILEKAQICGLEIVGYRYLSTIKPTSDTVDSYSKPINIIINGSEIHFDNMPRIVGGRTMVPLRKIFEALGVSVEWNGNTNTITASDGVKNFEMQIENLEYEVSGQVRTLDVPAMLINDTTYVPVRVIAEAFDADVSWDQATRTVSITTQSPSSTTAQKTSSEVKPGKVITGNSEYDNLIFEHNKNIPLKTIVDDFDGDGLNEVIAIYGSIKDKKTNRAYGDAVVYNFAGQFSGKYILDSRNFYLDQIKIVPVSNGDEEQKGLQFRVGYDSLRLDYIYVYDGDRFVETEKLGGTALPEERSQEEEWESVKLDRWFANFDIMINYLKDRNEWHALEWNESAYDTYTNINGENVLEKSEKPYFYTSYFQDIYEYDAIEVTPEFLKTFEGGNSLYKYCINEKKKGNKVQVLYRANGYVHINLRQYNEKVGLVHNTNKTYRTYKGNISSYESTNGIYHKTNTDWWTPRIQLDPSNVAWQYQTDTSEDFNDVSSLFEGHTLTNELSATVDDENISERIAIARANLLLRNSNYEFLKKLNGVDKAFAGNLNAALPAAYHSLNNYRSQLLKSAGLPTNYKTFYELVLIDLLSYKVDSDNITSTMEKTLSVIESYVYAGYKETKNRRKVVNNILKFMCIEKDANYKLFDDTIGDIFKLIDSGKASIEEVTKMISAMTEFNKYADEKMTVLDSIYEKTDDNELKKACVSVKQYVNAAKNKNMSSFKSKLDIQTEVTLNEIVDWEIDSFTDIIVDEMIKGVEGVSSAAGSVLIGAKAGKDIGLLIGNQLFDADNMTTAMLTLDTLCKIDDTLKSVLNDTEAKYKSDMTYENAITLTTAADLSKTLQMYSCDVTKDLVNSVKKNEQNMYKYAPILPYNSILTITKRAMGKMPDYDYLEQTLDKLKGQFEAMDLYMGGIDIAEYIYSDKSTESSDWSKPYIERARRYAILPDYLCMGYKRGITRTEFCTYIVNLLEAKTEKNINDLITEKGQLVTSPFDDCTYYYVDCVYKLGIISGMSDNEFKPLGNLTREQAAKILFETAKILGIDTSASASNLTGVSEWAKDGVNFVVDRNIMTGTDNGFEPQSGYSKEQALTSLVRFYENLK